MRRISSRWVTLSLARIEIARSLNRITIPEETRHRIEALIAPGSTLTISDTGVGRETGEGTDFITITRG